jgi:phenylalanyl-tRNA synthetase beta chain
MLVRKLEDRLAGGARFHQTISYSFAPDALLEKLGLANEPHVTVQNAINEGASRVRRSVVPSVIALLESNRRRRAEVRLFETGKGYVPEGGDEPREVHEVAIALSRAKKEKARFDDNALSVLRAVVDDAVQALGLEPLAWSRGEPGTLSTWAHPGRALLGRFGDRVGCELAALEPGIARAIGLSGELDSDTALARLDVDALLAAPARTELYRPLPQFPDTLVDVALALPEERLAGEAEAAIRRAGKGLVAETELFDVYSGGALGPGRKSLAWHVVLRASDRTLGEADVKKFLDRLAREATEQLGGELRRG